MSATREELLALGLTDPSAQSPADAAEQARLEAKAKALAALVAELGGENQPDLEQQKAKLVTELNAYRLSAREPRQEKP